MKRMTAIGFVVGLLVLLLATVATVAHAGEIAIIANPNVTVETLARGTIAEIYLNTKTRWENDEKIRVVMLKTGATHEIFVRDILKTTTEHLTRLWKKVVFTGAGTPPKIVKEETGMVEFVAETPGAIGYIDAATPHEGVKVISISE